MCLKRSALHWLLYCFDLNELQESTTHLAVLCSVRLLQLKYKIRCLHKQELFILCVLGAAGGKECKVNIKWGIRQRAAQGISKLYDRKCYGYDHEEDGKLIINEEQATVVRKIFNWYLGGLSINGIIKELEAQTIKSPTGKDKWNKCSLEVMLSNEKYKGAVRLFDDKKSEVQYLVSDNHPAIITEEIFEAVQKEKANRSNIVVDENGHSVRKSTKYSSKNKN